MKAERHVFASNASRYETAWATFGASPGVDGALATRLEALVPWGSRMARLADPPRIGGDLRAVAAPANVDRLGQSLLPVEPGLWAWSVWGAFGPEAAGGEWRVLTHTVLLDAAAFGAVAGHPPALLWAAGGPAPWLEELATARRFERPEVLQPLELETGPGARARSEAVRRGDLDRWRAAALEALGGGSSPLEDALAATLEALSDAVGARRGGEGRHVAMAVAPGGPHAALLRLAWHGLPVADRLAVPWISEQRRTGSPRAVFLGLPGDEWEGRVPEDTRLLPDEAGRVSAPSEGRRHWASLLARGAVEELDTLTARMAARRWSVVARDDLSVAGESRRWRRTWLREGPSVAASLALAALEARRPAGGRWRAVGRVLGEVLAATPSPDLAAAVAGVLELDEVRATRVLRGAVRRLRSEPETLGLAGALRTAASDHPAGTPGLRAELRRLVDRESDAARALLRRDPEKLLLAAVRAAAADGDRVALGLARLAAPAAHWSALDPADLGARVADEGDVVLAALVAAVVEAGGDAAPAVAAVAPLLGLHGVEAVADALSPAGAGPEPAATDDAAWRALVAGAGARGLARPRALRRVVRGLGAGRLPFGVAPDADAGRLARRLVDEGGLDAPDAERGDALLRLLWAEGTGATIEGWATRPERAPLMAALLTAPAPPPLDDILRDALERAGGASGPGPLEPWRPALEAMAPATWEALVERDDDAPRAFVTAERW